MGKLSTHTQTHTHTHTFTRTRKLNDWNFQHMRRRRLWFFSSIIFHYPFFFSCLLLHFHILYEKFQWICWISYIFSRLPVMKMNACFIIARSDAHLITVIKLRCAHTNFEHKFSRRIWESLLKKIQLKSTYNVWPRQCLHAAFDLILIRLTAFHVENSKFEERTKRA